MNRISAVSLVAILALGASVSAEPTGAGWAGVLGSDAPAEVLSAGDLADVAGGLGSLETDECVAAVVTASTAMKVGGGWLAIGNPIMGLAIVGLGMVTSAAIAFC